jgi:hypothetical protein
MSFLVVDGSFFQQPKRRENDTRSRWVAVRESTDLVCAVVRWQRKKPEVAQKFATCVPRNCWLTEQTEICMPVALGKLTCVQACRVRGAWIHDG